MWHFSLAAFPIKRKFYKTFQTKDLFSVANNELKPINSINFDRVEIEDNRAIAACSLKKTFPKLKIDQILVIRHTIGL